MAIRGEAYKKGGGNIFSLLFIRSSSSALIMALKTRRYTREKERERNIGRKYLLLFERTLTASVCVCVCVCVWIRGDVKKLFGWLFFE